MRRTLPFVALSLLSITALPALAQTPASPGAPTADVPAAATPADAPVAAPEQALPPSGPAAAPDALPPPLPMATNPDAPPLLTVEDRLGVVEGKVEGLDEATAATRSTVDKLAKLKVSGYIQGRFEYHGDSVNGLNAAGKPGTTNQFLVRRGRLKTTYEGTNAEYMLQIDATGSGVALKDAEATFVDTWSPLGLRLTVGQFKWPFGYEILQSSGDREMPERSLVIRRLFPGERDRGLRLTGKYQWLRFAGALVNGSGTSDLVYPNNDQNTFKDLVGRVGGDFEWLVVGLSGYWGRSLITNVASPSIRGTDRNMDGLITPDELTIVTPATTRRFSRKRLGADAQLYFDVPALGGLALKGEFVLAKDTNLDYGAVAAAPCADALAVGWIATLVQNVGDYVGVVARVDYFDPVRSKSLPDSCTVASTGQKVGAGDATLTVGGGLLLYGSGNIKGTFTYEHIGEQGNTIVNDIFTAQLQARF